MAPIEFQTLGLYNELDEARDAQDLPDPADEDWAPADWNRADFDGECYCSSCTGEEDFPPDPADEDWGPEY